MVTQRASEAGFDDLARPEARAGPEESEAERDLPCRSPICLTTREAGNGPPLSTSISGDRCRGELDILKLRMNIKPIYWASLTNNCTRIHVGMGIVENLMILVPLMFMLVFLRNKH